MSLPRSAWQATRARLTELLAADSDDLVRRRLPEALRPLEEVTMHLPAKIGDYTAPRAGFKRCKWRAEDFYSSREHATNVGAAAWDGCVASVLAGFEVFKVQLLTNQY